MRYTTSNVINKPLDHVAALYTERDSALKWMPGLKRIEEISGEPGTLGAKCIFHSEHKGKALQITETILEQNMPNQIEFGHESSMGYSEVEIEFEKLSEDTTRQMAHNYFELKGMMKVMGFLFKGMFKKQTMIYLNAFKAYAEK